MVESSRAAAARSCSHSDGDNRKPTKRLVGGCVLLTGLSPLVKHTGLHRVRCSIWNTLHGNKSRMPCVGDMASPHSSRIARAQNVPVVYAARTAETSIHAPRGPDIATCPKNSACEPTHAPTPTSISAEARSSRSPAKSAERPRPRSITTTIPSLWMCAGTVAPAIWRSMAHGYGSFARRHRSTASETQCNSAIRSTKRS